MMTYGRPVWCTEYMARGDSAKGRCAHDSAAMGSGAFVSAGRALVGQRGRELRVFELAPDMVSIAREVPVDQPPMFTEGAFMHERGGIYYLSYSSGHWNMADYSVHYTVSTSPTGPWKYRGPILVGDRRFKGPGHHVFVQDPATGEWLIVYHRWENKAGSGPYTDDRRVAIQMITYDKLGQINSIDIGD